IPGRTWLWSLLAGGLGMAGVMCLAFLTVRLANIPQEALNPPFDISAYPVWTKISILLSIAAVAGVVEEAAFRGYMLSPIVRRHGWMAGIVIVGLIFYVAHIGHAYATIAFLPFFLTYSILQGTLVYLTGSILPSVLLHAVSDFLVTPVQYGMTGSFLDFSAATYAALTLIFAAAALPAFYCLAAVTRQERPANG
ncbi:MAG: CPBP family intramembrane metalloprotease, partial [candidate division Zixibacteria bacterium]|nr:CPBP family intramembrane metalloprotease [candidate division Zixibacteria bacterium]